MNLRVVVFLTLAAILPTAAQAAPSCFNAPPLLAASPAAATGEPICDALAMVLATTPPKDIAWIPGAGVNAALGLSAGGFPADTYVLQFRVSDAFNKAFTGRDELVRLASDEGRARGGSWWTLLAIVTNADGGLLTVDRIENALALPAQSIPKVVAYSAFVQPGTLGYVGLIAPAFGRDGGALQFWFPSEPVVTTRVNAMP